MGAGSDIELPEGGAHSADCQPASRSLKIDADRMVEHTKIKRTPDSMPRGMISAPDHLTNRAAGAESHPPTRHIALPLTLVSP